MAFALSPLYPILDVSYLPASLLEPDLLNALDDRGSEAGLPGDEERRRSLSAVVSALAAAGVTLLQYRNKHEPDGQLVRDLVWLRMQAPESLRVVLNDRLHLVRPGRAQGLHIGQRDVRPDDARALLGSARVLGLSTHTEAQVRAGDQAAVDYLAAGPIYATSSKADAEAVVGLAGLRRVRALTRKPLVAIGGIALDRAAEVRAAGADSVAVISGIFGQWARDGDAEALRKLAEDFLAVFR